MAAQASGIQMLPPTDFSGNTCDGVASGLLEWDGATPIKCVPGTFGDSNGNVGIGTTHPRKTLEVNGNDGNGWASIIGNSNGVIALGAGVNGHSMPTIGAYTSVLTPADLELQPSGGNVGIGTVPGAKFQVEGTPGIWTGYFSGGDYGIYTSANANGGAGIEGYNVSSGAYGVLGWMSWGAYCEAPGGGLCGGNTSWSNVSDGRLKTDIRDLPHADGLSSLLKLRPVRFHWRDQKRDSKEGEQMGFVAQDVEKIYPSMIRNAGTTSTIELKDGKRETVEDTKVMSYATVVVPLVKAVQELKADNDNLAAAHTADAKAIDELRHEVAKLKRQVQAQ